MPINVVMISHGISDSCTSVVETLQAASNGINIVKRRMDGGPRAPWSPNTLINWGCSNPSFFNLPGITYSRSQRLLNPPTAVNLAANKISAFNRWRRHPEVTALEHTTNRRVAHGWLERDETAKVYCRTTVRGNSGDGIVVARRVQDVVEAPLYTKGINIHHEYRFHVMNGVVIDGVRKAFRPEIPEAERNRDVMNHAAGTMFVRSGPALERASRNVGLKQMAVNAVTSLGLDFGAVDILSDHNGNHYVIEVNTACGLEGTTLERYTRAFTETINNTAMTPWSMSEFNDTTTETGTSPMNISEARQGQSLTFNPAEGNNISTLTRGTSYIVERVSLTTIFIRNDAGRITPYQPRHFVLGLGAAPVPPVPPVAPVVAPPTGPSDGSINTEVPPTSPQRIVRLGDGTSVNVGGTCDFSGTSNRIEQGQVTIADMRRGVESGDVFLGIDDGEHIYRFRLSNFSQGIVVGAEGMVATPPPVGSLPDINNRPVVVGSSVIIRVAAGGHGLAVGTVGTVSTVNITDRALTINVEGTTHRVHPSRVAFMTPTELSVHTREQQTLRNQATTSFTIGSNTYRVPASDLSAISEMLRRFTV